VWGEFGDLSSEDERKGFARPAILRFNHDGFMDELLALTSYYPERLVEWVAQPETWREPMPTPATAAKLALAEPVSDFSKRQQRLIASRAALPATAGAGIQAGAAATAAAPEQPELKLYQPAHQRYYLVVSSLVCRKPGLPDRVVDAGRQEQVGFVVRRLVHPDPDEPVPVCDPSTCDEYAFVQTEGGPRWRKITGDDLFEVDQLIPDEERLPLFGFHFDQESGFKRRLLAGLIPVARREAYLGAPSHVPAAADGNGTGGSTPDQVPAPDPRRILFEMQVTAPWKALVEQAQHQRDQFADWKKDESPISDLFDDKPLDAERRAGTDKPSREQIQTASWYVLLDFAHFLDKHLHNVWQVLAGELAPEALSDEEGDLFEQLENTQLSAALRSALALETYHAAGEIQGSLRQALEVVIDDENIESNLESVDVPYDRNARDALGHPNPDPRWPRFLFPLADPVEDGPLPDLSVDPEVTDEPDRSFAVLDELAGLVEKALPETPAEAGGPDVTTAAQPVLDTRDAWFVIRCVYERPNCGPFHAPVVSAPTDPFQMAAFFDPDAPARPVRIAMPVDISPAGLRKFNKNATFMISDVLCGQLKAIRKMTLGDLVLSVLPWPFHKDLPDPSKTGPCKDGSGNSLGMFFSLSIPIVTLCAMILMMIMVALFDMVFRWLPYLFVAFPIPGFKGKKS
jgi:hypothetical protein